MPIKYTSTSTSNVKVGTTPSTTTVPIGQINNQFSSDRSVIDNIVNQFKDQSRAEIKKWRAAIRAAKDPYNPRYTLLQDLYENLADDGHWIAATGRRKSNTLCRKFIIKGKDGKEDPEKTKLLKTEWFYECLDYMLDAPFYGFTVLELTDLETMCWELIPRRNVIPQWKLILFDAIGGLKAVNYTDPEYKPFFLEMDRKHLGLMNAVVPELIWKRNASQAWADFIDRFGIPLTTATTNKQNKADLDRIEYMLRSLGQAAQGVFPEGTTITVHDSSTKGDPYKVFDAKIQKCDFQISKAILGGTMVLDNGSSRSQSEVHEDSLEELGKDDRTRIEFKINGVLIPILRNLGFGFEDGDTFEYDESEELSLLDFWKIVSEASGKWKISKDWVSDRFGFPIEDDIQPAQAAQPNAGNPQAFSANFQ